MSDAVIEAWAEKNDGYARLCCNNMGIKLNIFYFLFVYMCLCMVLIRLKLFPWTANFFSTGIRLPHV